MQDLGREMLYINQRLLPADRAEANRRATRLKTSLAELDEAARLQDGESLRKSYINVATGFSAYAEVIPAEAVAMAETFAAEEKVTHAVPPAPSRSTPAPQPMAAPLPAKPPQPRPPEHRDRRPAAQPCRRSLP